LYTYARFPTLEMTALDDPDFESQFRTELITSVAQAANVNEDDVTIDRFSAGSVVVEMTVKFASAAYAAKTAFQELMTNTPEAVFGSSATLTSYGPVEMYFSGTPLPAPVSTPSLDGSSSTVRTTANGTVSTLHAPDGSFVSETTVVLDAATGSTTTTLIDDTLTTTTTLSSTSTDETQTITTTYALDVADNAQSIVIDDYATNTRDTTINYLSAEADPQSVTSVTDLTTGAVVSTTSVGAEVVYFPAITEKTLYPFHEDIVMLFKWTPGENTTTLQTYSVEYSTDQVEWTEHETFDYDIPATYT
jgi:hypothetical protein